VEPIVIIPTFWTRRRGRGLERARVHYDHPTPVDADGTFAECLASLEQVRGLGRVLVLVAATDESVEAAAEDRVRETLAEFPGIDAFVFGAAEMGSLHRRMEQLEFADLIAGASLNGYGGVRNVGLLAAAALGAEMVVFFDDDQVVLDPDFLIRAEEGIGEHTAAGRPVLAKSGYYVDERGSCTVGRRAPWHDAFWRQDEAFDRAIAAIATPPRMKPSPLAFGGCLALHRDMYCNVSFDPWAVRGEDIDYVINVRMHGGDVYLDSEWAVMHRPPDVPSEALHFRHDVFRFVYTHRKLEFSKSQVDLRQVTAESLEPYPGPFVHASIGWRARLTAALRAVAGPERGVYLRIATHAVPEAQRYARENCERYFAFQRRWPMLADRLWEDIALQPLLTGERRVDRSAITGRFPVIRAD
jgi:GT2 family glycosyltransferase